MRQRPRRRRGPGCWISELGQRLCSQESPGGELWRLFLLHRCLPRRPCATRLQTLPPTGARRFLPRTLISHCHLLRAVTVRKARAVMCSKSRWLSQVRRRTRQWIQGQDRLQTLATLQTPLPLLLPPRLLAALLIRLSSAFPTVLTRARSALADSLNPAAAAVASRCGCPALALPTR